MLRPSSGSDSRSHEPPPDEPVDAVGHRAARDERLLQQCLRAQLERLARAAQGRQHVPLPRLQVAAAERVAARAVEVAREPVDAREHLERREVEIGPLRDPRFDDPIDFVRLVRHVPIIAAARPRGRLADLTGGSHQRGRRGPPWCNGSTTAFGAVRSRFESWRRSMSENQRRSDTAARRDHPRRRPGHADEVHAPQGAAPDRRPPAASGTCSTRPARSARRASSSSSCATSATWSRTPSSTSPPRSWSSIRTRSRAPVARSRWPSAHVPDFAGDVLVLSGDVPLLDDDTLARLDPHPPRERRGGDRAERGASTTRPATAASSATRPAACSGSSSRRMRPTTRHPSPRSTPGCTSSRRRRCARTSRLVGTANAQGERISPTSSPCCATRGSRWASRRRRMPQPRWA